MFRRLLVILFLGNKEECYRVIRIKGSLYMVCVRRYEPADNFINRMEKALQKQGEKKIIVADFLIVAWLPLTVK